jgi:ubiquinone/menaquinone biosynthesis C-methylase UbiE
VDPRDYYDRMSEGYERERHRGYHRYLDDAEAGCVADLARGAEVLEVGCGTGLILARLAPIAVRVAGVDLSEGMLSRARARGFAVEQADATRLPYPDASFDLAVCFKVLPHVPAAREAVAEMARVVRPGGAVAFEVYNRASLRRLVKRLKSPTSIAAGVDDTDVYTRYDSLASAVALLPPSLRLDRVHGIRIAIPAAALMRLPLVGPALAWQDRLLGRTPLKRLAGFLVLVARRR